jgi:hypothetical protein
MYGMAVLDEVNGKFIQSTSFALCHAINKTTYQFNGAKFVLYYETPLIRCSKRRPYYNSLTQILKVVNSLGTFEKNLFMVDPSSYLICAFDIS